MKIRHTLDVAQQLVQMEGAVGCRVRWLLGEPEGAPNFAMRQFEVAAGGHTPKHSHPYEHEVFVLEGHGVIVEAGKAHPLKPGDAVFVAPNDIHQFRNTGEATLKFLCLIPQSANHNPVAPPECGNT